MIGYADGRFGEWVLIALTLSLVGYSLGLFLGSMFNDVRAASGVTPMLIMPFMMFSGFYANRDSYGAWIGWIEYLSPF